MNNVQEVKSTEEYVSALKETNKLTAYKVAIILLSNDDTYSDWMFKVEDSTIDLVKLQNQVSEIVGKQIKLSSIERYAQQIRKDFSEYIETVISSKDDSNFATEQDKTLTFVGNIVVNILVWITLAIIVSLVIALAFLIGYGIGEIALAVTSFIN